MSENFLQKLDTYNIQRKFFNSNSPQNQWGLISPNRCRPAPPCSYAQRAMLMFKLTIRPRIANIILNFTKNYIYIIDIYIQPTSFVSPFCYSFSWTLCGFFRSHNATLCSARESRGAPAGLRRVAWPHSSPYRPAIASIE